MLRVAALLAFAATGCAAQQLLIVADEIPAMELLADNIRTAAGLTSKIVPQAELPADLSGFQAVIVYIHKDLGETAEEPFIAYAKNGGKLILLHHSISSGKRKNKDWFSFLDIKLPLGSLDAGGYKYYAPVAFEIVNLAPQHYITTHNVKYDEKVSYTSSRTGKEAELPGTTMRDTEVYVNHQLSGDRTILLGVKYRAADSGKLYMQDMAGWLKQTGAGMVLYFMPGHRAEDFDNPVYKQILVNAVMYKAPSK